MSARTLTHTGNGGMEGEPEEVKEPPPNTEQCKLHCSPLAFLALMPAWLLPSSHTKPAGHGSDSSGTSGTGSFVPTAVEHAMDAAIAGSVSAVETLHLVQALVFLSALFTRKQAVLFVLPGVPKGISVS